MRQLNRVVENFEESIFSTMSKLSQEHKAINLSQGFPDFHGPEWIRKLASDFILDSSKDYNQYAPAPGIPDLQIALSKLMEEEYQLSYSPETEITITNGATEALFLSSLSLFNPGDEVIVFEPFYDSYMASLKLARLTPKVVTLHAPEFRFDTSELKNAIGPKTRGIIWNDPHNPSGRVFTQEEKKQVADLAISNDLIVISDHVYEFLTYDNNVFSPIAGLEGMKDRTIHISSAGKTFGLTGWKIGWAMSSPKLSLALRRVHQFKTFCVAHPLQKAIAETINNRSDYLKNFKASYLNKRDLFTKGLEELGLKPLWSEGTYFTLCPIPTQRENDIEFCQKLIEQYKVSAIPPSAFYERSNDGQKYIRFCFAKKNETLETALESLKGICD